MLPLILPHQRFDCSLARAPNFLQQACMHALSLSSGACCATVHAICGLSVPSVGCVQAAVMPKGSMERLLLVAAFAVSAFQSVGNLKCTLPIMGETYEARNQMYPPPCTQPCTHAWPWTAQRLLCVICPYLQRLSIE